MPIQFSHNKSQNFLTIKIEGTLSWDDLKNAALNLTSSSQYPANIDTLYDLRDMDFSNIDAEFENNIIEFRKSLDRGDARIACVVSSELGFGMGRMYEMLSEQLPQQTRVFRSIEEAEDWLTDKIARTTD